MTAETNAARRNDDGTVAWRAFLAEATERLRAAHIESPDVDARRIVEEAAGFEPAEFHSSLDDLATERGVARFDAMLARRLDGEPLQYVLGRWPFRTLDLAVDGRVLIPRPETEVVAGLAIGELQRMSDQRRPLQAVDLGTGTGAIGLSLVAEHDGVDVICTDVSDAAIAAARANLAGLGVRATRVQIRTGSWFDALPDELAGAIDLIVSNPPYIGESESLPAQVIDWEPRVALMGGPTGFEEAATIIVGSSAWLRPGGSLVLELAPDQLDVARELAIATGFGDVTIHPDLAGRQRALVARLAS